MKLPHAENALVDIRKLKEYCLNEEHLRGRHKARVFKSVLGLTADDADFLQAALLTAAADHEVELGEMDAYGQRYVLDFDMTGPAGTATIRSTWIIRVNDAFPRLTSCYVL